jgi:hypothetical protein
MPDLNPKFKLRLNDIVKDKFNDRIVSQYEIVHIDTARDLYTLRNLSTNAISKESMENIQIFFIKEIF